tara:strand:- start:51634 stop:54303 length:2670 start_codon:yes stop_codon:yes gene_type:complete
MNCTRYTLAKALCAIALCIICVSGNIAHAQDEQVRAAQEFLSEQGYSPGPADGFWGPHTEQAVSEFQRNQELDVTGQLDELTLQRINQIQNPPPPTPSPRREAPQSTEREGQGIFWWIAGILGLVVFIVFRKKNERQKPVPTSGKRRMPDEADTAHHEDIRLTGTASPQRFFDQSETQKSPKLTDADRRKLENFRSTRNTGDGWIPAAKSASIQGFEIGGMVYVGTPPLTGGRYYSEKARCFIDPSLPIAKNRRDYGGDGLSYWPSYSDITPTARATYLDWLQTGRNNPDVNPGYLFLYFYGLERRYFVDSPSEDEKREIVEEVRRLISVFPNNYSVENYLGTFLDVAEAISLPSLGTPPAGPIRRTYELSPKVAIGVGSHLLSNRSLNSEWLFFWFMNDVESRIRTPASRCGNEFKQLFSMLFDDRYPEGMAIKTPKKSLKVGYKAASSEFETEFELKDDDLALPIPDISTLRKPLQIAQDIADEAMEKLDSYSRFLGRSPEKKDTMEAHLLLPAELRLHNISPEIDSLKNWVREASSAPVSVAELTQKIKGETPTSMTKKIWSELADSLGALNFSMAPDPLYSIRRLKIDDTVILFETPSEGRLRAPSVDFESSLVNMAIASMIAHADGHIAETEVDAMAQSIDRTTSLTGLEKDILHANLKWFLANPPDLTLLRTHLKNAAPEAADMIRQHAIAITKADGLIHADEVRSLERIYKALGLDENRVYSDLHGEHSPDAPLTVRSASVAPSGETIPSEPEKAAGFKLDHTRVSALSAETAKVKSTLTQIFETGDESETLEDEVSEDTETTSAQQFDGLSPKHAQFVRELIQTDFWSTEDFERLAQVHGLLPAGALEAVNEWSFERFDDALIEEYEGYELNGDIVAQFRE